MRENRHRFAFWISLFFALSTTVGGEDIVSSSVYPRIALVNPYQRTTFRFRWQIEPHKDNRRYAVMYTCGSEIHSSQGEVDGDNHPKTTERYVELTVMDDCEFMACVVRIIGGKPKTICAWAMVASSRSGAHDVQAQTASQRK